MWHSFSFGYKMQNTDEFIISQPDESSKNFIATDKMIIPVMEEQVTIEKEVVEKAIVRLSKIVHNTTEQIAVPLMDEEITVTHVDKNEYVDTPPPAVRYEGDVMIISVLKEVPVITKRLMLVEELHVSKKQNHKNETVEVILRKEEVDVNRTENKNFEKIF